MELLSTAIFASEPCIYDMPTGSLWLLLRYDFAFRYGFALCYDFALRQLFLYKYIYEIIVVYIYNYICPSDEERKKNERPLKTLLHALKPCTFVG